MAEPFSVEIIKGRLLEVRIRSPIALDRVKPFSDSLRAAIGAARKKVVICVDLRWANVFPPDVTDAFIAIMRADNPVMERSAFLTGGSALFSMQIERMIRDAQNPARRAFREVSTLTAWLAEALTPAEQAALALFLEAKA